MSRRRVSTLLVRSVGSRSLPRIIVPPGWRKIRRIHLLIHDGLRRDDHSGLVILELGAE